MLPIPKDIQTFYKRKLQKSIAPQYHQNYFKWLRFYLDFCDKYNFPNYDSSSLSHFLQKLATKKQNPEQLEEAQQAVTHFLDYFNFETLAPTTWENALRELNRTLVAQNYSKNTVKIYVRFTRRFADYTTRDITEIDDSDVRKFLNHLAIEKKSSASAQKSAFFSLLFFYKNVLKKDFGDHSHNIRFPKSTKLPVVLSRVEIEIFISNMDINFQLMAKLQYGCGLRISELFDLRLKDIDFENNLVCVWMGKGKKNRVVPLPLSIKEELQEQVNSVISLHKNNSLDSKYKGSFLPNNEKSNRALEPGWQWLFPAKSLVVVGDELWQYHIHQSFYNKKITEARRKSGITKQVTSHTFRHSYATHLLIYGLDIRSVQELLGHANVETTMTYLQLVRSLAPKSAISPLDIPLTIQGGQA